MKELDYSGTKDYSPGGDYPSWLYAYATVVTQGVAGLNSVTDRDIQVFHERGYLVIHNAFSAAETGAGLDAISDIICEKLSEKSSELKGLQFENAAFDKLEHLNLEERHNAVRKLQDFIHHDKRLEALAFHRGLLGVLNRIVGEEVIKIQDMALLKPPLIGREKPWHQDMAFFNLPLDATVVGAWLALDEATPENGCMMVIPGSHKRGAVIHFKRRDWQICDTDVYNDGAVAVPLKPGSLLLFHGLIHHGTPANTSVHRRRALQFHYCGKTVQASSEAERLATFGSEGKNVSC